MGHLTRNPRSAPPLPKLPPGLRILAAVLLCLALAQASCAPAGAPQGPQVIAFPTVAAATAFTPAPPTQTSSPATASPSSSSPPFPDAAEWSDEVIQEGNAASLFLVLSAHEERITAVEWSPDGSRLAVGKGVGETYTIQLLEIPSLDTLDLGIPIYPPDIAFSPDGNFLFAPLGPHGPPAEWDLRSGELTREFEDPQLQCADADVLLVGADGRHLVTGYASLTEPAWSDISTWDTPTGACTGIIYTASGDLTAIDLSPDKGFLLLGFGPSGSPQPPHLDILDATSFKTICTVPNASAGQFIPRTESFVALSSALDVYELPDCSDTEEWYAVAASGAFAFSPDGALIVSTVLGTAEVRSRESREILARLEIPSARNTWVRFSPDGRWLAIATDDLGHYPASLTIYGIPAH